MNWLALASVIVGAVIVLAAGTLICILTVS